MGRRALGLFAAAWFVLALQPCAAAMEQLSGCLHCPTPQVEQMAMHHDHNVVKDDCASLQAQCGEPGDINVDGRTGKLKVKDVVELPVAITAHAAEFAGDVATSTLCVPDPPHLKGNPQPLYLLNCVYLD